jgi:hypothetical protein
MVGNQRAQSTNIAGRLFNYARNVLTIFGIALAVAAAILIAVFTIVEFAGGLHNPYIPVLAYLVLPVVLLLGLVLIPVGMVLRRRGLVRQGTSIEERSRYPLLDFNDPQLRRVSTAVLSLIALSAVVLASTSYLAVEHMDTVEFCGTVCHTVMRPEYNAYEASPHARVTCVECHIGPGASWFVRAKVDGLRQVWKTMWNTFHRPIPSPVKTLRPAREVCESCHWPDKHHGDKVRTFARFAQNAANTPSFSVLLLKTGGGRLDLGRHGGIHWWHIYSDNRIRYVAGDERREEIVWVELTTPDGEVRAYARDGDELPPPSELEDQARVMDCIDCHNRPTHLFEEPSRAIDAVLEGQADLRQLPYFKRQALKAIKGPYETHDEGVEKVRAALVSYYESEHPQLSRDRSDLVARGAEWAASVYDRSFFPEMNTDWETHPNHIGHEESPGCWRCHDDEMTTADGEHVIGQDCELCHAILIEDVQTEPNLAELLTSAE